MGNGDAAPPGFCKCLNNIGEAAKSFLLSGTTNSDGMYLAKHKTIG